MSALVGALGSVIGYLGSEVAEKALFERLMWPQRYYSDFSFSIFLKQSLFMTMGGPLHAAALETLDVLRDNGLYLGTRRGDMLGTAFLQDTHVINFFRTDEKGKDAPHESRNGFWVEVLRDVNEALEGADLPRADAEAEAKDLPPFRAMQLVRHLKLKLVADGERPEPNVSCISEEHSNWKTFANILCSEFSALAAATVAGTVMKCWWLVPYMCIPLILKILSVFVSVRRYGLESERNLREKGSITSVELFQVQDPNRGFTVIEGPAPVVQQFFRHYGHPKRDRPTNIMNDRNREVLSILMIYVFVLYFPAGLVANLWMSTDVQYLWLGYQLYAILVMHVVRILGWEGCGRTEERVAALLKQKKEVWIQSIGGYTVAATLTVASVPRIDAGKSAVRDIIAQHSRDGQLGVLVTTTNGAHGSNASTIPQKTPDPVDHVEGKVQSVVKDDEVTPKK